MLTFGLMIAGFFGKGDGLSDKAGKAIGWIALAVACALALAIGVAIHDHRVVKNHDLAQTAATAKADRKADEHAAETRRADDATLTAEESQLKEIRNDPTSTATERRLARQRCIRMQQSSRASGRESPACG